jgi:hypothetical protein
MTQKQAELLQNLNPDFDLHDDYSGRGMFGKSTYGIVVQSLSDFFNTIGDYIQDYADETEEIILLGEILSYLKWDNMGLEMIVY